MTISSGVRSNYFAAMKASGCGLTGSINYQANCRCWTFPHDSKDLRYKRFAVRLNHSRLRRNYWRGSRLSATITMRHCSRRSSPRFKLCFNVTPHKPTSSSARRPQAGTARIYQASSVTSSTPSHCASNSPLIGVSFNFWLTRARRRSQPSNIRNFHSRKSSNDSNHNVTRAVRQSSRSCWSCKNHSCCVKKVWLHLPSAKPEAASNSAHSISSLCRSSNASHSLI